MLNRRSVLAAVPLTLTAALGAAAGTARAAVPRAARAGSADAPADVSRSARFDLPWHDFAPPGTVLRHGAPEEVGLDPAPIRAALDQVAAWTEPDPTTGHPMYSGQVSLLVHDGVVVAQNAAGYALRYADQQGDLLPAAQWIPMRTDTIFDLASLSKLFTSIVAVREIQDGGLGLDDTVAGYLPEFATNGKAAITIRQLLTHTSGLPADPSPALWQYPDMPSRVKAILDTVPQNPPDTVYLYSDLNMLSLQLVLEHLTGKSLDSLVRERVTGPLGLRDTMYNPPASLKHRIAAEEYEVGPGEPQRGLVWGQVHDENAWAMGGVAGHAGVFSTVADIAVLSQAILNGGTYRGHRILSEESVRQMMTNYNQKYPGDSHGLGFELDQRWYMGRLDSAATAGHTGFTGTTIVVDPLSRSVALQFSNRVHPTRNWGSTNAARRAVADGLADAMAVRAPDGRRSWYSGITDASTATLTATVTPRRGAVDVSWTAFVDTETDCDLLTLESSTDGGATWQPASMAATGTGAPTGAVASLSGGTRSWWRVTAQLDGSQLPPSGASLTIRWQYTTDPEYTGRGVDVTAVRITDARGTLLDGDRDPGAFTPNGWTLTSR
ncbi:serine hydrolase [Streptantibioticus parmotrematis]|uniref:serine hydrolase n=1 Tax=Streptantibioticus parmotrematis TaxID=2873249 RepID=UPI003411C1D4